MISYKSYDLGYLWGIMCMMRPEHRDEVEIPKDMQYMEPWLPHDVLMKETKELFLYMEGDYVHIIDKLKVWNRKPMPVSQKENLIDSNSSSKCNRNRIIWVIYFLCSVHMIMIFLCCKNYFSFIFLDTTRKQQHAASDSKANVCAK